MTKSTVPIELPGDPTADLHATTKAYVDEGLALKPGVPYFGPVPAGSTTPTIEHGLGTNDVDVTVYRVSDGVQVGVPADRIDTDNVQLTFSTAPTSGQYRVVVSAGTGSGGPGGGGGGTPDPHAASHASAGSDPITPASIGAATSGHTHEAGEHDHSGVYAAVVHTHSGLAPTGGTTGQVLTKDTNDAYDFSWQDPTGGGGGENAIKPFAPITLTARSHVSSVNGFTYRVVDVDASLGTHFRIDLGSGESSVSFITPINGTDGQSILFEIRAIGQNCNAHFSPTNAAGGDYPSKWTFGDVQLGTIPANTAEYTIAIYDARANSSAGAWRIISNTKGYPV